MKSRDLIFLALLMACALAFALSGCTAAQLDKATAVTDKVQAVTTQPATTAGVAVVESVAPASTVPISIAFGGIAILAGFMKWLDNRAHGATQDTLHTVASTLAEAATIAPQAVALATEAGLKVSPQVSTAVDVINATAGAIGSAAK